MLALGLWLGFVASAAVSFNIVTYENGQPAAWYATSFLAGGLLLLNGRVRNLFAAACLVALPIVIILNPEWPLYAALILTVLAALEAGLATMLTLRLSKTPRIANVKQLGRLLLLAVLPAILVTITLAATIARLLGEPFLQTFTQGLVSHLMGLGSMLPAILVLATPNLVKGPKKGWIETILLGAGILMFAAAPFTKLSYATFLLIFPAATIFAFRLGAKQTVTLILSLTTLSLVTRYVSPDIDPNSRIPIAMLILIGQLYTMAVIYNALFTALAVNHQARVKRHLQRRTEIARRSRSRALKASKAKTDFLATMSHELRTPMNGIMGFTQVLLRRPNLDPEMRDQLRVIETSGAALLTIVSDILDFAKVEAGRVTLRPEELRLQAVAEEALAIVSPAAEQKGLKLSLQVEGDAPEPHMADGARLRQVLLNLLNNAVKFTDQGEVALVLILTPGRVRFEVRDTGVGIAAEDTERLFQRFSQVDGSKTRNYGGTGLGLAICKGLVELMGGTIGVESEAGKGSVFWFEAPLGHLEIQKPLDASEPEAKPEPEPDIAAPHVLLVDDHPVNRQLVRTMLAMVGCTCDEAENGKLAVEAVRKSRYHLVLMDIHMPVMDGLAATKAIRAMGGPFAELPIIAVTADILPESVEKCRAAGINEHMGKPLSLEALVACMNRSLEAAQARDTLAA